MAALPKSVLGPPPRAPRVTKRASPGLPRTSPRALQGNGKCCPVSLGCQRPKPFYPVFYRLDRPPVRINLHFRARKCNISFAPPAPLGTPLEPPLGLPQPCPQVPPQHTGDSLFLEGDALQKARERQRQYFRAACKRKLGGSVEEQAPAPRKRRRLKTYITIMMLDNAMRVTANARLTDFAVDASADGGLQGDPFQWRSLSVATDSGPDCAIPSAVQLCFHILSCGRFLVDQGFSITVS